MELSLYKEHIKTVVSRIRALLEELGVDFLMFHAGSTRFYPSDDIEVPFKAYPHFARMIPVVTPNHLIVVGKTTAPLFVKVSPKDFWEERKEMTSFFEEQFLVKEVSTSLEAWKVAAGISGSGFFIGDDLSSYEAQKNLSSVQVNPKEILESLNYFRSKKTSYEVSCIEEANRLASIGHEAARNAFIAGGSEFDIYIEYLKAVQVSENALPYPTIIALNEKAAILHYEGKRTLKDGQSFLIDAGVSYAGYASDITRTYSNGSESLFEKIISEVETLKNSLVDQVKPGVLFIELHHKAHLGVARILKEIGLTTAKPEVAVEEGITRAFFPYGLGHHLGIQVHDVGSSATDHSLKKLYPTLRFSGVLEEGNVITIEPGIYFIDMLLKGISNRVLVDWNMVERLKPFGGVRNEDNIVVTASGAENITQKFL